MTTVASRVEPTPQEIRRLAFVPWLSGRLILLTLVFSILAQIVVYIPAGSNFVRSWTSDRIMGARMTALALSAVPPDARDRELGSRLLAGMDDAIAIDIQGSRVQWQIDREGGIPNIDREIDVRTPTWLGPTRALARALFWTGPKNVRLIARGVEGAERIDLIIEDTKFRNAVLRFTRNFFLISSLIALITGVLLYLALHMIVVRPVRSLTSNIAAFAAEPEDAGRVIAPSGRQDEIGRAEEALARMETTLASALRQKRHLADLGLAVSKINHELRNMLTTAQLVSDRLGDVADPTVQRIAPRLIGTLGRAIEYCDATLAYGRASERDPRRERVLVAPIVAEQLDLTRLGDGHPIDVAVDVPPDLVADADPEQLGRVLLNLMRNAVEALGRAKTPNACIEVSAERQAGTTALTVCDNGPGISEKARSRLFSAFQASDRSGGTGLGLPVVEELIRLHGGTVRLVDSEVGACFRITIPDRRAA